ncbi:hypothetical protein ABH908_000167 [Pseudomonas frederiksbergensis]|uniref:hypothetical protein n=1 Tax=Pseudomonas TaxID=286 RepID=UPI003D262754
MNVQENLKAAGLEVVSGHRRAEAILTAGGNLVAYDGEGSFFRIDASEGGVTVTTIDAPTQIDTGFVIVRKLENHAAIPVADLTVNPANQRAGQVVFMPVGELTANPMNQRAGQVFSMRAECAEDAEGFFKAVQDAGVRLNSTVNKDGTGLPDVDVEFHADASIEQLRDIIRRITDGHVMLQTLRPVPLAGNSLDRDESVS